MIFQNKSWDQTNSCDFATIYLTCQITVILIIIVIITISIIINIINDTTIIIV